VRHARCRLFTPITEVRSTLPSDPECQQNTLLFDPVVARPERFPTTLKRETLSFYRFCRIFFGERASGIFRKMLQARSPA